MQSDQDCNNENAEEVLDSSEDALVPSHKYNPMQNKQNPHAAFDDDHSLSHTFKAMLQRNHVIADGVNLRISCVSL